MDAAQVNSLQPASAIKNSSLCELSNVFVATAITTHTRRRRRREKEEWCLVQMISDSERRGYCPRMYLAIPGTLQAEE